jgi:hypothetical protein
MTGSRSELTRRIAWRLFLSGIGCYMLLSPQSLDLMHVAYEAQGGTFIEKMRPGTYCIALAFMLLLAANGNPFGVAARRMRSEPLLAVYATCQLFVLAWTLARHGMSGAAFMIDTVLMPVVCVLTLTMIDERRYYEVLVAVLRLLVLNSLIALAETLLQHRLIPMHITGQTDVVEDIFRPSALLGHPLNNSIITVSLLPAALYLRISMAWRCALILLFWTATLAFGGRTAFVLATVIYGAYFLSQLTLAAFNGRFNYLQLTGGLLAGILSAAALAAVIFTTGLGDRIFKSLVWDSSAEVRSRIWDVFDYVSSQDMLLGISPQEIMHVGTRIGLAESEAIENFWIVILLQVGWIGFIPFFIAMVSAFIWLIRSSRGAMRCAVVIFFAVASSNNSLTSKTISFSMLVIMVALTRKLAIPGTAVPQRIQSAAMKLRSR